MFGEFFRQLVLFGVLYDIEFNCFFLFFLVGFVDGEWGVWSFWIMCFQLCGILGGEIFRRFCLCNKLLVMNGGNFCVGNGIQIVMLCFMFCLGKFDKNLFFKLDFSELKRLLL